MKLILLVIFSVVSISAETQFKDSVFISNSDKLRFLDSLNKYRIQAGVKPLQYSFQEDSLAKLRSRTILNHLDSISEANYMSDWIEHLHYNFDFDMLDYDRKNVHKDTVLCWTAECSARLSKFQKADDLINRLFQGWKNSKAHWEVMLDGRYEHIALNWIVDNQRHVRLQKGTIASLVLFSKDINKKTRGT